MTVLLALIACQAGAVLDWEAEDDAALEDSAAGIDTDGGSADGGSADGGSADGGTTDGGSTDGGSTDGGSTDGGAGGDTGTEELPDAPGAGAGLDELFGDEVIDIHLTIDGEAWSALYTQSDEARRVGVENYDFQYVECTVSYDGRDYGPVGVRIKGQGSFQPIWVKSSLKLKFDLYDEDLRFLDGLNRLTLNNMTNDYSMAHERVAYRVYREAGVPASRAGHAQVYINDELFGLYTVLETVDRDMIRGWYKSDEGVLYEGWDVDFMDRYVDDFELEFGDDEAGRQALAAAAAALEGGTGQAALDAADAVIDVDQFLRFWAAEAVVGQFDAYPYSSPGDDYFVYLDPADGRFDFLPWGNDETFYSPNTNVTSVYGILAQQCLRSASCEARLAEHVWEVMGVVEGLDDGAGWLAWYDGVVEQIQPYVEADTHKVYGDATVATYQGSMRDFIAERASKLQQWVGPRP